MNELLKGKVIIMEEVTIKNNIFPYIENLVSSLEIGLLNIFNKYFYRYNLEVKRDNEITKIAIKGHLKSRQEKNEVISSIWIEYGILKEPYSEPKEPHEIQWEPFLDKEINYKGTIKQLEVNFSVIIKKINKFIFFTFLNPPYSISKFANIEIEVKIGSKSFCRSSKELITTFTDI